jgi:hypothetical protein
MDWVRNGYLNADPNALPLGRFRFWCLGPKAAEDLRFIEGLLASLQRNWSERAAGYIEAY